MASELIQLPDYSFPSGIGSILGSFRVRAGEIAKRSGLHLETWQDPELGAIVGFAIQLPSGRVVLLREWGYEIQNQRGEGPYIEADTTHVAAGAAEAIFGEAVSALNLCDSEIGHTPQPNARLEAARLLEHPGEAS